MRISNGALCNTHRAHVEIDSYRLEQKRTKLHWHFVGRVGK